jgi:tripartite-type tricarboxylate transporter receptor subunit TctC
MSGASDRRRLLVGLAGLAGLTGLTSLTSVRASPLPRAAADAFPQRAVRLIVPYSVGVGPDIVARSLTDPLAAAWGQPVLVDNRPGGSGIVAFGEVRRTPADGHTIFLADTATLAVNPLLHRTLPYDPQRDLVPLTLLFHATFVLWTGAGNRLKTLADLLQAARESPGRVTYATLGNGHASHVAVESMARAAGLQLLAVPFKDFGALITAVAAGEVDFTAFSVNTVAPLLAAGRVRPLAVAARQRLAAHPQIPTLAEAGGPPVEMHPWAGLVTVAGTPEPVLAKLRADIGQALQLGAVRARAEQAGFELTPSTPQALVERMRADTALYAPLVAAGRIARY